MKNYTEEYYQSYEDALKECLELAESIDDTYMVDCIREWLGKD